MLLSPHLVCILRAVRENLKLGSKKEYNSTSGQGLNIPKRNQNRLKISLAICSNLYIFKGSFKDDVEARGQKPPSSYDKNWAEVIRRKATAFSMSMCYDRL